MNTTVLPEIPLPASIRSRFVDGINGLRMHVLEAGFETSGRPCVLLLHGFPELAYSWRKVMPALAAAGYHVIAPDQRGYGRSTGWDADYDGDLGSFRMPNLVRDALGLVSAFGYRSIDAVVGHDFGSSVAAWCALMRPDVFRSVAMMSAPFGGPPPLPFNTVDAPPRPKPEDPMHRELAALPRPRKHYQWYYSTRQANADMHHAPQGVHDFMRAYYHHKSADWKDNTPYPLQGWTATELAKLPTYYVMDLAKDMAATAAEEMPSADEIAANGWLPDRELSYYSAEYARTGFQGGLQWYRCGTSGAFTAELELYSGRTIDVPSCFIAGKQDWGIYQRPGVFETMQSKACTKMIGCHLVEGAGHWVQQEQPAEVNRLLLQFLAAAK
jgi:pimeloyl-ACP methyl ester carboxylesterase